MSLYELDDDYQVNTDADIYLHDDEKPEDDWTFAEVCNFFGHLLEVMSHRGLTADLLDWDANDPDRAAKAYIFAQMNFMGLKDLHRNFHQARNFLDELVEKEARGELVVYD